MNSSKPTPSDCGSMGMAMRKRRMRLSAVVAAVLCSCLLPRSDASGLRRAKSELDHDRMLKTLLDPTDCTDKDISGILHKRNGAEDPSYIEQWASYNNKQRQSAGEIFEKASYLDLSNKELFVRMGGTENVDFVYWGNFGWEFEMSAYTTRTVFTDTFRYFHKGQAWSFVDPASKRMNWIQNTTILDDGSNYVVVANVFFDQYQHILIDHLGYLAFLRKKLPPNTKFIIPDWSDTTATNTDSSHHIERLLTVLDPQFAKERVVFLQCSSRSRCNQKVEIRNGGWLTLFRPPTSSRDPVLYSYVREWVLTKYPTKQESLTNKSVVFYTRGVGRVNGRVMDPEQEQLLMEHTKHLMRRFDRPEQFVLYDGSISIEEQIDLFQSATVVIGPHGGGLANVLFTLPGKTCAERPKVLEFVTSGATQQLQNGLPQSSYYTLYQSMPWVELHNVLYSPDSTFETTKVNEESFYDALFAIFSPNYVPSRDGLHAISLEGKK